MDWGTCKQSYQTILRSQQQQQQDEQHFRQQQLGHEDAPQQQQQHYDGEQEFRCKREDRHEEENDAQYAHPLSRSNSGSYFGGDRFSADPGYAMPLPPPSSSYHPHHHQSQQQQQDTSSFGFPPAPMAMEALNNSSNNSAMNCSLNSIHSLDLQNFDESASVDLQQLFPPPPLSSSSNAMQQHHHQTPSMPHTLMSYYASQNLQPPGSNEYFVEGARLP